MVIYDICCENQHHFEGWFSHPGDFEHQLEQGLLDCPVCGCKEVRKLPTGSKIRMGENRSSLDLQGVARVVEEVADYIEQNYTDVGDRFPEEVRKIHYGEIAPGKIYGNANADEVAELQEEGIDVIPVPVPLRNSRKLN